MTRQVTYEDSVLLSSAKYLDDPVGLTDCLDAIKALADDPRPANATPWGTSMCRLRVGRYRVMYSITADEIKVVFVDRVHVLGSAS